MVYDDLEECPSGLNLRFVFDYNMLNIDAFSTQVKSVNVWAFDSTGKLVWTGHAAGEELTRPNYIMETPLTAGTYDFIAWCGLDDNADFNLDTYTPESKTELEVRLKTIEKENLNISSSHFKALFHGMKSNVEYVVEPMKPSVTTVTIPLIKDTNDIAVMLVNEDGTVISREDFSVSISYADSWLEWNNDVAAASPVVNYQPWSINYGETTLEPITKATTDENGPVRSTLLCELSTSRLMEKGKAWLDVVRLEDNTTIIHVPIIEYFLLEKGERHSHYSDQEYLDRRDDYSALFFIDKEKGWYMAGGIYINSWAIVPPQSSKF